MRQQLERRLCQNDRALDRAGAAVAFDVPVNGLPKRVGPKLIRESLGESGVRGKARVRMVIEPPLQFAPPRQTVWTVPFLPYHVPVAVVPNRQHWHDPQAARERKEPTDCSKDRFRVGSS